MMRVPVLNSRPNLNPCSGLPPPRMKMLSRPAQMIDAAEGEPPSLVAHVVERVDAAEPFHGGLPAPSSLLAGRAPLGPLRAAAAARLGAGDAGGAAGGAAGACGSRLPRRLIELGGRPPAPAPARGSGRGRLAPLAAPRAGAGWHARRRPPPAAGPLSKSNSPSNRARRRARP